MQSTFTWESFTERARAAVWAASIGTKVRGDVETTAMDLLLGLTRDPDSCATHLLVQAGVSLEALRASIETQSRIRTPIVNGDPRLSATASQAVDLAYGEARRLGNDWIGTEHLLLGLLGVSDDSVSQILDANGILADRIGELLLELQRAARADT